MLKYSKTNYHTNQHDFGVYKAIVIDNNDVQIPNSGRVQIFIPELHSVNLQQFLKGKQTIQYKFPGNNIISDLDSNTLNYLKTICPWCIPSSPVTGESGPGLYNGFNGNATTNDNPCYGTSDTQYPDKYIKPGAVTESAHYIVPDAFSSPRQNFTARGNSHGAEYRAPVYSNCPKGSFAIPRVGAMLLVAFYKGDANFPVYIGCLPSAQDFSSIFAMDGTTPGYPGGFETPVDTTNLQPPVKTDPDPVQQATNQSINDSTKPAINKLPPLASNITSINNQLAQNDKNIKTLTATPAVVGTVTYGRVPSINDSIDKPNK